MPKADEEIDGSDGRAAGTDARMPFDDGLRSWFSGSRLKMPKGTPSL
jgi:hypothetical protein